MARGASGKAVSGGRHPYGYEWADVRRADGRLARERLVENPLTAPVLRRIFALADAGHTQRQIAGILTSEHVPVPSGTLGAWDPSTIHHSPARRPRPSGPGSAPSPVVWWYTARGLRHSGSPERASSPLGTFPPNAGGVPAGNHLLPRTPCPRQAPCSQRHSPGGPPGRL